MYIVSKKTSESRRDTKEFYNDTFYGKGLLSEPNTPGSYKALSKILKELGVKEKSFNKKILDIACGSGKFIEVASEFIESYGIDISEVAIGIAKKRIPKANFRVGESENLPYDDNFFDFITCFGSLEHFIDMDKALREMKRVIKPDGKLFISVPNLFSFYSVMNVWLKKQSPKADQELERYAGVDEWSDLFNHNGFSIESVSGGSGKTRFGHYLGKHGITGIIMVPAMKIINLILPTHMHRLLKFILVVSNR